MATPRASKKAQKTLTQEMSALLAKTFLPDLTSRARQPAVEHALRQRWQAERDRKRTAADFDEWVSATVEQVGAAWILSCVFVRVLEDRGFLDRRRIAGEGADDSLQQFLEIAPALTERDYLLTVFRELATYPGATDVLDPAHNPAWRLSPSNDSVRALLTLLHETDAEGILRFRFGREETSDTRFLGDLYQDLSESVRKRHALLQTPDFVERFILDQTLEPAIKEFGLETVRLIDPTCGSGHFLLGAYHRLFEQRQRKTPGVDRREHANAALMQVYGIDINPYAVAIARFRLTLAYLEHAGIDRLALAPRIETNLVVADSLLHGAGQARLSDRAEDRTPWGDELFALDDREGAGRLFEQRYHAVVGNPPYIVCQDDALRVAYRDLYDSCHRQFSLGAPFTERFFELSVDRGFVGLINSNSFMKREFGTALIEKVLSRVDLTEVIDASGAYIPGHGTPTVLLFGRNCAPVLEHVRVTMGKRGEPQTPAIPADGLVWSSIAAQHGRPGYDGEFISVVDVPRRTLAKHPWSLGGGGAADLKESIERRCEKRLADLVSSVGRTTHTGEDSFFFLPTRAPLRSGVPREGWVPLITGEQLRDWGKDQGDVCLFPYDSTGVARPLTDAESRLYWPFRTLLKRRQDYGQTIEARGLNWWEHSMFFAERFRTPLSIAFAFVATHNHFVLDRGGKVFNRSAPIIKLSLTATEDDHLALLAYLNSSAACFWMKQVFMNKGATSDKGVLQDDPDKFRFEFDGTKLVSCPIPDNLPTFRGGLFIEMARELTELGERLSSDEIREHLRNASVSSLEEDLQGLLRDRARARRRMVALQEKIDWSVYELLGFLGSDAEQVRQRLDATFELEPDDRSFLVDNGIFRDVTQRSNELTLIERGEFKRRWYRSAGKFNAANVTDDDILRSAVEELALDMIEGFAQRESTPISLRRIRADIEGERMRIACRLIDVDLDALLEKVLRDQSIPWTARLRFDETGWVKQLAWRSTWELQRMEDGGESVEILAPERYGPADFSLPTYWRLRGKLDVPKERFISYPGLERDDDKSPLVGWAGWNHLQRAQALATLFQERKDQDGWPKERLVPILAGLLELIPWVKQWHNNPDPAYDGQRMGEVYEAFVSEKARALGVTTDELQAWRPADAQNGKRKAKATTRSEEKISSDDVEAEPVEEAVIP